MNINNTSYPELRAKLENLHASSLQRLLRLLAGTYAYGQLKESVKREREQTIRALLNGILAPNKLRGELAARARARKFEGWELEELRLLAHVLGANDDEAVAKSDAELREWLQTATAASTF